VEHVASARDGAHGLDVVGLGALNIDLITPPSANHEPIEDAETCVTGRDIIRRLTAEKLVPHSFLGGSAFNAMAMFAQLGTGLKSGMMGISARPPEGLADSHRERLADLRVADLTWPSQRRHAGLCLALSTGSSRRLFTAPGANVEIADYLVRHERPRRAVKTARVLHLTSLLEDPDIPGSNEVTKAVASFVEMAKSDNPGLFLSFDPGMAWVERLNELPELRRIYALTDLLYINPQERADLSGGGSGSLVGLCPPSTIVILKARREVMIQRSDGSEIDRAPLQNDGMAVDPTGAGDALAAGVLAAIGCGRDLVAGCRLGLRIAGHRVADFGDRGHVDLRVALGSLWSED
jgi:sugar/nucleoside kinase (ribokinase family)